MVLLTLLLSLSANATEPTFVPDERWVAGDALLDLSPMRDSTDSFTEWGPREEVAGLVADGFVFEGELVTWRFDSGTLFPILMGRSDDEWADYDKEHPAPKKDEDDIAEWERKRAARQDRQLVGFVFLGEGTAEMNLPDPNDRRAFGNHQVRFLGADAGGLRGFVDGTEPLKVAIDRGFIMTASPAQLAGLNDLPPVGSSSLVLVGDDTLEALERKDWKQQSNRAEKLFEERMDLVGGFGFTRGVLNDWLERTWFARGANPTRVYADFHTDRRFGLALDEKWGTESLSEDQWLTSIRDDSGTSDPRLRVELISAGQNLQERTVWGTLGGLSFPTIDPDNPLTAPFPALHMEPVFAEADLRAEVSSDLFFMDVAVENKFTIKPSGGDIQRFSVSFPTAQADRDREKWKFGGVTLEDGTPVTWSDPEDEDFHKIGGTMTIVLPRPLKEGEEVTLLANWEGTWPYGNSVESLGSLGRSTGLQDVHPGLSPGFAGNPWKFITRAAVPKDSKLTASVSGRTVKEWDDDEGWHWVEATRTEETAMWANVAIGKWINSDSPESEDMPAVRVHMFPQHRATIETFAPEMRRIISYFEGFLPKFPYREIELFQAPSGFYGFVWIAPHAMVNLQATKVYSSTGSGESLFRDGTPHLEAGVLAHELAHTYWGHVARPVTTRDFWMAETFAEIYACMYVGAAFGTDDFEVRMANKKDTWEEVLSGTTRKHFQASLTKAYNSPFQPQVVYEYGPYVFQEMLRPRIGNGAFYGALDILLQDYPETTLTTETFQEYFEMAWSSQTGKEEDLSDFWDFWIHGGFIPQEVVATYETSGGKTTGKVTADVPFGTFDVPIRIHTSKKAYEDVWVVVTDGEGDFEFSGKVIRVEVDPDGRILARKRKAVQQ